MLATFQGAVSCFCRAQSVITLLARKRAATNYGLDCISNASPKHLIAAVGFVENISQVTKAKLCPK